MQQQLSEWVALVHYFYYHYNPKSADDVPLFSAVMEFPLLGAQ